MLGYHKGQTGRNYYAKPLDASGNLVESPWGGDAVTGYPIGTQPLWKFTLDSTKNYVIYDRAGGSPASTDSVDGWFDAAAPGLSDITTDVITGLSGIVPKVVSAYDPRTQRISITRGDDLNVSSGTQIDIPIALPSGVTGASSDAYFGASKKDTPSIRIDNQVSLVQIASKWYVRVELTSAMTSVAAGEYDYTALVVDQLTNQKTVVNGTLDLLQDVARVA